MTFKSDIEIAQEASAQKITQIAKNCGIEESYLEQYGNYKAKIDTKFFQDHQGPDGKLILVTAITPTPAGEGKTTTSVGLADGLRKLGKKSVVALREPSLGPVFGVKGGAAGGGWAQVVPMEDINLHFTGDFHAIGAANNLMAAMLDNHIQQGNALGIDVKQITWKRAVDMNDRQLRHIVDGLGGKAQGVPREDGFEITVASEIMAVLCLSTSITDLKEKLGRMIVAYTYDGKPVTAHDLKAEGAMAALLKDALKPNLVQTLEGTPAFIHGGPFANIAHGCNSIIATRMALKLGDYAVTEAGFAADLGAEKFIDIKCRKAGLKPSAVVIVATVRALKYHGGVPKADLNHENLEALEKGLPNLLQHVENRQFHRGQEKIRRCGGRHSGDFAAGRPFAAAAAGTGRCRRPGLRTAVSGLCHSQGRSHPGPGAGDSHRKRLPSASGDAPPLRRGHGPSGGNAGKGQRHAAL